MIQTKKAPTVCLVAQTQLQYGLLTRVSRPRGSHRHNMRACGLVCELSFSWSVAYKVCCKIHSIHDFNVRTMGLGTWEVWPAGCVHSFFRSATKACLNTFADCVEKNF